jgi:hypothetical protein
MLANTVLFEPMDLVEDYFPKPKDKAYIYSVKKVFLRACRSMNLFTRISCARSYEPDYIPAAPFTDSCQIIEDYWVKIRHFLKENLCDNTFKFVMDFMFLDHKTPNAYLKKRYPPQTIREGLECLVDIGYEFKKLRFKIK